MKYPWLEEAIQLETDCKHEASLDAIFDALDNWLLEGCFELCDQFLLNAREHHLKRLSVAQLLTILTATHPAKEKLKNREDFFIRSHTELLRRYTGLADEPREIVDRLLKGLGDLEDDSDE